MLNQVKLGPWKTLQTIGVKKVGSKQYKDSNKYGRGLKEETDKNCRTKERDWRRRGNFRRAMDHPRIVKRKKQTPTTRESTGRGWQPVK